VPLPPLLGGSSRRLTKSRYNPTACYRPRPDHLRMQQKFTYVQHICCIRLCRVKNCKKSNNQKMTTKIELFLWEFFTFLVFFPSL
jgi:hypothetical protein